MFIKDEQGKQLVNVDEICGLRLRDYGIAFQTMYGKGPYELEIITTSGCTFIFTYHKEEDRNKMIKTIERFAGWR